MYKYYLTQRPPSIGTHPIGAVNVVAFDKREMVMEINRMAWGYAEYRKPLSELDMELYELTPACEIVELSC